MQRSLPVLAERIAACSWDTESARRETAVAG